MFLKAVMAFLYLPGIVAFFLPITIALYDPWRATFIPLGFLVVFIGLIILLWCVRDFYVFGKGTLAPWEPTNKLIVNGLYQFVRNPMYLGVLIIVLGWGIVFTSLLLVLYMFVLVLAFHIRVVKVEEPYLKVKFKDEWESYYQKVPRWIPSRFSKE